MMNRFFRSLALAFAGLVLPIMIGMGSAASAVNVFPLCNSSSSASNTDVCKNVNTATNSNENPVIKVLKLVITIVSFIIGIAAVIIIILAGIAFMTANGDTQSIGRARSSIIYALVGLIVVALAQVLVAFVLNKL